MAAVPNGTGVEVGRPNPPLKWRAISRGPSGTVSPRIAGRFSVEDYGAFLPERFS